MLFYRILVPEPPAAPAALPVVLVHGVLCNAGVWARVVRFLRAPADGGTEVHVDLHYEPPAGRAGAAIAKLFGEEPELQLASDLRRFKQVLETGEVVRSDASIHEKMHPAQPPVGDLAVSLDVEGGY